jgi:predicted acyl esterase
MEDTWIPMKDDVRLAVKLYMPHGAKAGEKFPAVLEYHPYRKDDGPTPIPNTAPSSVKPKASSG